MGVLKMNVEDIVDCITLATDYWDHAMGTNCYAFALGLDIEEDEIAKNAYQVGVIGAILNNINIQELRNMSYEERLSLDLNSMKIPFIECDPKDKTELNQYKIAMFANFARENDFHFMREEYDGTWWQKWGGLITYPINEDHDGHIITDPRTCNIGEYKYIKTYTLTRKKF